MSYSKAADNFIRGGSYDAQGAYRRNLDKQIDGLKRQVGTEMERIAKARMNNDVWKGSLAEHRLKSTAARLDQAIYNRRYA